MENINKIHEAEEERRNKILETGNYAKVEVIVGTNDEAPFVQAEASNCSVFDVAKVVMCLDDIKESLIKRHPMLPLLAKCMDKKERVEIEIKK